MKHMKLKFLSLVLSMSVVATPVIAVDSCVSCPPIGSSYYTEFKNFYEAMLCFYHLKNMSARSFIDNYDKHIANVNRMDPFFIYGKNLMGDLAKKICYVSFVEGMEFSKYSEIVLNNLYIADGKNCYVEYLKDLWSKKLKCFGENEETQKSIALLLNILILMRYCIDSSNSKDVETSYWKSSEGKDLVNLSSTFLLCIETGFYNYTQSYREFFRHVAHYIIQSFKENESDISVYILDLAYELEDFTM